MTQELVMVRIAVQALEDKKAEDIHVIDISEISSIGDYFIIANGTNTTQLQTLIDNVDLKMHEAGASLKKQEGGGHSSWTLMDYGDVIVHIFDKEGRSFYDLEHIWQDGRHMDLDIIKSGTPQ